MCLFDNVYSLVAFKNILPIHIVISVQTQCPNTFTMKLSCTIIKYVVLVVLCQPLRRCCWFDFYYSNILISNCTKRPISGEFCNTEFLSTRAANISLYIFTFSFPIYWYALLLVVNDMTPNFFVWLSFYVFEISHLRCEYFL